MAQTSTPPFPNDAQMRARALSRWEGEGGMLGRTGAPSDVLDESELRILARIGAATLTVWNSIAPERREALVEAVCRPLQPGDGARAKADIASFIAAHGES